MKHILTTKFIGALMGFSILLLFAYVGGAFNKRFDLLTASSVDKRLSLVGAAKGSFEITAQNSLIAKCVMPASKDVDFCGVGLTFTDLQEAGKGKDFSSYSTLEFKGKVSGPIPKNLIRLTMRNFHPNYSTLEDGLSLKYNTVTIPGYKETTQTIDLELMQVETWWVRQLQIPLQDSKVDISNVPVIQVEIQNTTTGGEFSLIIDKMTFRGSYLGLQEILIVNSLIWISVITLLVFKHNRNIRELSTIDPLTKVANRRGMQDWLNSKKPSVQNPCSIAVCYLDIDDFKTINDTFGHKSGDMLLIAFSDVAVSALKAFNSKHRYSDAKSLFVRMSGDEFALLFQSTEIEKVSEIAESIFEKLKTPVNIGKSTTNISISAGIAQQDLTDTDIKELLEDSDKAMYVAKKNGKNQYRVFDQDLDQHVAPANRLAKDILEAIEENQFGLNFMPIFNAKTKRVSHVEVLLRGESPNLENVSTNDIIASAEAYKLVNRIDAWVLNSTLSLLSDNRELVESMSLTFCVNISTLDLQDQSFADFVIERLNHFDIPAPWIELEITEAAFQANNAECMAQLHKLKEYGVGLTLDEFGTGYTAFNQLMDYPVNKIKIDRKFTSLLGNSDKKSEVLVNAILLIAETYDLEVSAIGVETLDQYYALTAKGISSIQGYLFSEPLTLKELDRGLRNQSSFGIEDV